MGVVNQQVEQENKSTDIKYMSVELTRKSKIITNTNIEDMEYGLFKGLDFKTKAVYQDLDDTRVIIYDNAKKTTKYLSLKDYNIVSFEIFNGSSRDITFFWSTEADQKAALSRLNDALVAMQIVERVTLDQNIIDVSSYTDIAPGLSIDNRDYNTTHSTSKSNYNTTTTTTNGNKKEASAMKRSSKVPTKEFLHKLKASIDQIRTGDYEEIEFPIFDNNNDDKMDEDDKLQLEYGQENMWSYMGY